MKNKPGRKQRRKHWHEKRRIEARRRKIGELKIDLFSDMMAEARANDAALYALITKPKKPITSLYPWLILTWPVTAWRGVPAREGRG